MSTGGGAFGGAWQDEGIYFTIVVHAGLALIFIIIILALGKTDKLKRVLRPSRPHSSSPRFATGRDTAALFESHENEVAMRVSIRAAVQLLLIKYRAHIFIGAFLSAALLSTIFATDNFFASYTIKTDAFDCKSRTDSDACSKVGGNWCKWTNSTSTCSAQAQHGLFDLTLLNVTPTHYRSWLIGAFTLAFHLWFAYCIVRLMVELRVLAFASKTMPVQLTDTKPLQFKLGSRSVRVAVSEEQTRRFDGTAASLYRRLLDQLKAPEAAAKISENVFVFERLITRYATAATVSYLPPRIGGGNGDDDGDDEKSLTELIAEEQAIVAELEEIVAEQRVTGEPPAKGCCSSEDKLTEAENRLKLVRGRIEKLASTGAAAIAASATAAGASINPLVSQYAPWKVTTPTHAFITFDTAAHALRFLNLVTTLEGQLPEGKSGDSEDAAALLGPGRHLDHERLPDRTAGGTCKMIVYFSLYVFLLFFATAVVTFFGSIESLSSIPGLSIIFGVVVTGMPKEIFLILQAYLPVIALAVFQAVLPMFVVATVDTFWAPNWEKRSALTFRMWFVYLFISAVFLQTALQGGIFQLTGLIAGASLSEALNFIVSMFSPKGGYFFALVASATTCGQLLQILWPGNVVGALFLAPRENIPEKQGANEVSRPVEMPFTAAATMLMFSIGIVYHTTSPLLCIFVGIYFVTAYYSTRAAYLDAEDRSPATNPASEATLSNDLASAQLRFMLLLHTLSVCGTFALLLIKFLWGGAALCAATLLINAYLWHLKWSMLDPVLNTTDEVLADHYDHMVSFRGEAPAKPLRRKEEEQKELLNEYLPPFANRTADEDLWAQQRQRVLQSIDAARGKKYEASPLSPPVVPSTAAAQAEYDKDQNDDANKSPVRAELPPQSPAVPAAATTE